MLTSFLLLMAPACVQAPTAPGCPVATCPAGATAAQCALDAALAEQLAATWDHRTGVSDHPSGKVLADAPPAAPKVVDRQPAPLRFWGGTTLALAGTGLLFSESYLGRTSGILMLGAGLWLCVGE
jgi:hypothetical protein